MAATAGPAGRLLLLDSASLYFRAYFGVPDSVRAPDGAPVNAVRGFLETVARLVAERRPTRLVACWDEDWRPAFRVEAVPSYKAHRVAREVPGTTGVEDVPEALTAQVPAIVDLLAALGVPRLGAPGYEADDVIGTLVARESARPAGERSAVDVVTGDRDLFQLVDDAVPVRVLYPVKGVKDLLVVDQGVLDERYGVPTGRAYAEMAVLRSDMIVSVSSGFARSAQVQGEVVGGKTGTAQFQSSDGSVHSHALFTGFMQNENIPLAIGVVIEDEIIDISALAGQIFATAEGIYRSGR